MLAMPLLGWAQLSAAGLPIVMFDGVNLPAIVPTSPALYAWCHDAHSLLANCFLPWCWSIFLPHWFTRGSTGTQCLPA
jgi:cytochrome b561